jgi:hypothetical protein
VINLKISLISPSWGDGDDKKENNDGIHITTPHSSKEDPSS